VGATHHQCGNWESLLCSQPVKDPPAVPEGKNRERFLNDILPVDVEGATFECKGSQPNSEPSRSADKKRAKKTLDRTKPPKSIGFLRRKRKSDTTKYWNRSKKGGATGQKKTGHLHNHLTGVLLVCKFARALYSDSEGGE